MKKTFFYTLLLAASLSCGGFAATASAQTKDRKAPKHKIWENRLEDEGKGKKALAADFKDAELVTMDGKKVRLSDYVGKHKYVMVDFWASWCGPCMRELPNVKAAYEKYKSRGLEIVGISLDVDKKAWKSASDRVGITWQQMSDMNAQGSAVANLYAVQYIPYIVIFDSKGNIVAKNIHGAEMLKKLEELMPEKK